MPALVAVAAGRRADSPDALQVRSWAASCSACHGTNGNAHPAFEPLAGRDSQDIIGRILDFRSGRKAATVMHQIASGYSDEQIAAIAAWFAAQKK